MWNGNHNQQLAELCLIGNCEASKASNQVGREHLGTGVTMLHFMHSAKTPLRKLLMNNDVICLDNKPQVSLNNQAGQLSEYLACRLHCKA